MEKDIQKIKLFDGTFGELMITPLVKAFKSEKYNYLFFKENGEFYRWGSPENHETPKKLKNPRYLDIYSIWVSLWGKENVLKFKEFLTSLEDDGDLDYSVPEILDFEISTKCAGVKLEGQKASPCAFCYKSNNNTGSYISTEDYIKVIDKVGQTITQIALGIGNIDQPNLWEIMDATIDRGIVPNITINGDRMTDEYFDNLSEKCGAVAISYYDKDLTFNAIHELATKRGMKQINIHFFLAEETFEKGMQLIDDVENDPRAKDLNAIVFLSAKLRGNAEKNDYHILSQEKYNIISRKALDAKVGVGMDSCSAQKTLISYEYLDNFNQMKDYIEPCESAIFSSYVNKDGYYFPCSFAEGIEFAPGDWTEGISVLDCDDFLEDIWYVEKTKTFADEVKRCRDCGKSCAIFEI
jgi:MoaA/NifB/PqqE/SkfB family radical SAM enzyme